jgi:ATP-dependent DNA helicase RecQ
VAPRVEIDWERVRVEAFERFGVRRFRRGQRELIEAALSGRDAVGILPTGAGKSLTFQLPALLLPGTVVVASPLIALMQDQTEKLADADVDAARLDSTLAARETRSEEAAIRRGRRDVVYVTPERLGNDEALAALRAQEVSLFVVDEAHCVSQWGHDFRPAYLGLADAARALGRPPILALTATSPPQVTEDVVRQLGLRDPLVVSTGIERENLFFEVRECADAADKEAALVAAVREAGGAAIAYCATIRAATEVQERLERAGVAAELYHGKRRVADREEAQRRFMSGETPVMVATSAFGMGIDKPDIRLVAHWNLPDSVETYYQEAGRAGRDGEPSRALLLYRPEDRRIQGFFMAGRYPPREELRATWAALEKAGTHPTSVKKIAADAGLTDRHAQVALSLLRTLGVAERRGSGVRKARDFASVEEWDAFLSSYERRAELDRDRLRAIVRYAQTALCRMQAMRVYFGEGAGAPCGHCDNCRDRPQVAAEVLRAEEEAEGRPGIG